MPKARKRPFKIAAYLSVIVVTIASALAFTPVLDWSDELLTAIVKYNTRNPQEKVYLHFDKEYYAAGETIWFKGYLTLQGTPAVDARTLYVELRDRDGKIVQKKKLYAEGGTSPGNFDLPTDMKPGIYQVNAYTSWMLNYDSAFHFYRNIEIFNPNDKPGATAAAKPGAKPAQPAKTTATTENPDQFAVQFFPESGNLITNVKTNVAFKAIDGNGFPVGVTGEVKDSKGKTVATLNVVHDGMGVFEFTPVAGESYTASAKSEKGVAKQFALPAAVTTGAVLQVFNRQNRIFYLTSFPENAEANTDYLLVAEMQNQVVYKATLNASEGRISGFIPTKDLPSGIVGLTVLTKKGEPLAERLVFVQNNDLLQFKIEEKEIHINPREQNILTFEVPKGTVGSYSVSITDAEQVTMNPYMNNIISNTLLTSDIKGYVHNPAYYFKDTTANTLKALDLVMMTNGWRRYTWKQVIDNDTTINKFPYEQGIQIKGSAFTNGGRLPLVNGAVNLIITVPKDSAQSISSVNTDDKGNFISDNMLFRDTAVIYYRGQKNDKLNRTVEVRFDQHFYDSKGDFLSPFPVRALVTVNKDTLQRYLATVNQSNIINKRLNSKTIQLKTFEVQTKKKTATEEREEKYVRGMFTSTNAYTFDFVEEDPIAMNVFQYLQSRVAGLQITGDINNPKITWRGQSVALFLNEMQGDVQMLANLSVQDIALVKVLRPPFMGAPGGGAGGAIAVYLRNGSEPRSKSEAPQGLPTIRVAGYNIVKEFYSPNYGLKIPEHELPDNRTTLYWNPYLAVDPKTNQGTIKFFNNDFSKQFKIIVEGMDATGNIGRIEYLLW
ncbi:MG2 domain-containing protein [Chitinophaga skermanii]|uniref:MG2 domain-containing protein n=1 Tax=Chitinophaga skermanii TaxID=331697 RepID=A0A327QU61_9BACT|nr:MG2 domain-containing protein [Chitinophaga skermanii]RAJ05287.1 MG2 domain-containing protein [Chitinophaga skermanii]